LFNQNRAWGQTTGQEVVGGKWAGFIVAQVTTIAYSVGNSDLVTLTIQSLNKKFEFNILPGQDDGSSTGSFSNPCEGQPY
jgi:hypothetical protein